MARTRLPTIEITFTSAIEMAGGRERWKSVRSDSGRTRQMATDVGSVHRSHLDGGSDSRRELGAYRSHAGVRTGRRIVALQDCEKRRRSSKWRRRGQVMSHDSGDHRRKNDNRPFKQDRPLKFKPDEKGPIRWLPRQGEPFCVLEYISQTIIRNIAYFPIYTAVIVTVTLVIIIWGKL